MKKIIAYLSLAAATYMPLTAQTLQVRVDKLTDAVESKVVTWRRDFHQNPELSNRELRTAKIVADHLKALGLEVRTGIAHTGVIGVLKGGKPGPVIALRADMDALPVPERVDLPFASKVKATYNKQEVPVMHACGHDGHTAMLMGTAEVLSQVKKDIKGTIVFLFQPAEEGAPEGEEGGAGLMIAQGALENPKVEAIFGLHLGANVEVGTITYRPEGTMAASDMLKIKVKGVQAHGGRPWDGVDPIVVASQIVNGLQTIVSRQMSLTDDAVVVSIGSIHGGLRNNIIPESVEMVGTIRTLSVPMQKQVHEKIRRTATKIAESAGATAEVEIIPYTPVTFNNVALTEKILPSLQRTAGKENVKLVKAVTGAEDFAKYQEKIPGVFYFLGGMPKGKNPNEVASHHTPDFYIDEGGFKLGIRSFCNIVLDYTVSK
jgi:amidohydrolase